MLKIMNEEASGSSGSSFVAAKAERSEILEIFTSDLMDSMDCQGGNDDSSAQLLWDYCYDNNLPEPIFKSIPFGHGSDLKYCCEVTVNALIENECRDFKKNDLKNILGR
jgi:hypothetical protein